MKHMGTRRRPTPRYDMVERREDYQMRLFTFIVFMIIAITVVGCIASDIRAHRAIAEIRAEISAQSEGW